MVQSLCPSETSTKPARNVSDGCPVKLLIVSISSRSDGTSKQIHLVEDARHFLRYPLPHAIAPSYDGAYQNSGGAGDRFREDIHFILSIFGHQTPYQQNRTGADESRDGENASTSKTLDCPARSRAISGCVPLEGLYPIW